VALFFALAHNLMRTIELAPYLLGVEEVTSAISEMGI
jgi:hypothetical protein